MISVAGPHMQRPYATQNMVGRENFLKLYGISTVSYFKYSYISTDFCCISSCPFCSQF